MIRITPAAPPAIFGFNRANRAAYAQLTRQGAIRKALFDEQSGLCAYCERKLELPLDRSHKTRIEHFHPQNPAAASTLDEKACRMASGASPLADSDTTWTNLLLCCDGDEAGGAGFQHCDVAKHDADICAVFRNPKTFPGARLLEVHPDGTLVPIQGLPVGAAHVVNNVLMLNRKSLTTVRHRYYGSLIRKIARDKARQPYGLTAARRKVLRAKLKANARANAHPSVALAVAEKL